MTNAAKHPVFAKFIDKPILREDGRLVYALINAFAMNGHRVSLFENMDFRAIGPLGPLIYSIEGVNVTATEPQDTDEMCYLFDEEDVGYARRKWKKKVQVKFDVFSNYAWACFRGNEPLVMPYPMHPWNYGKDLAGRLEVARKSERKVRIFFSGDTKGYKRNRILYPRPKLTRIQVIDAILQKRGTESMLVEDKETLDDVLRGTYKNRCAIVDMSKVFVDDWLNNLARTEFFICAPGYVMPMCHNAVEAMAVGTIPIINYPEWFRPSLQHLETCIAFGDEADLIEKINYALRMTADDVARMRRNVINYYEQYLDPAAFAREVEGRDASNVTVLMITDGCVVKSASKLNQHSILIRDAPLVREGHIGSLLTALFRGMRVS